MLRITDQYFWNFVFGLFFFIFAIMAAIILETETRIPFAKLSIVDFTLITLASWRLTHLFSHGHTTKWLREQFYDIKKVGKGFTLVKPVTGPRRTLADLFSSTWSLGTLISAVVTFVYLIFPVAFYFAIFLSISAVASFLQVSADLIGAQTEKIKNEVEG